MSIADDKAVFCELCQVRAAGDSRSSVSGARFSEARITKIHPVCQLSSSGALSFYMTLARFIGEFLNYSFYRKNALVWFCCQFLSVGNACVVTVVMIKQFCICRRACLSQALTLELKKKTGTALNCN